MGAYAQAKQMAMPRHGFCYDSVLVQHVAPLVLQWPLTQLFPVAWASGTGSCPAYLSQMSMEFYETFWKKSLKKKHSTFLLSSAESAVFQFYEMDANLIKNFTHVKWKE